MDERRLQETVRDVHDHLAATAERPVERSASRWIGEAEAVAGDLVGPEIDPDVARDRLGHVDSLLSNVETTGDTEADEHVTAAAELVESVLAELAE